MKSSNVFLTHTLMPILIMSLHARHNHMEDIPRHKSQHSLLAREVFLASPPSRFLFIHITLSTMEAPYDSRSHPSTDPVLWPIGLYLTVMLWDVPSHYWALSNCAILNQLNLFLVLEWASHSSLWSLNWGLTTRHHFNPWSFSLSIYLILRNCM